jgi:hypothetical protein
MNIEQMKSDIARRQENIESLQKEIRIDQFLIDEQRKQIETLHAMIALEEPDENRLARNIKNTTHSASIREGNT